MWRTHLTHTVKLSTNSDFPPSLIEFSHRVAFLHPVKCLCKFLFLQVADLEWIRGDPNIVSSGDDWIDYSEEVVIPKYRPFDNPGRTSSHSLIGCPFWLGENFVPTKLYVESGVSSQMWDKTQCYEEEINHTLIQTTECTREDLVGGQESKIGNCLPHLIMKN